MTEQRHHIAGLDAGTLALLKDVSEATADKTVKAFATAMGIDHSNPIEAQRCFGALRKLADKFDDDDYNADQEWLRRTRVRSEGIIGKAVLTAVSVAVLQTAHALYVGLIGMLPKA